MRDVRGGVGVDLGRENGSGGPRTVFTTSYCIRGIEGGREGRVELKGEKEGTLKKK